MARTPKTTQEPEKTNSVTNLMHELHVRITLFEEMLGTAPGNESVYRDYIASKAPDAKSVEDEIALLGEQKFADNHMTVFLRSEGKPVLLDYQIKGALKDACGGLRTIPGTESSKLKAYKKIIDKQIFVKERKIPIHVNGEMGVCERPLRAQTMQGERVSLAMSETVPAGSTIDFTFQYFQPAHEKFIKEVLDYGELNGLGQWRNSGKGRFTWEEIPA